jgi:hypothetical protein
VIQQQTQHAHNLRPIAIKPVKMLLLPSVIEILVNVMNAKKTNQHQAASQMTNAKNNAHQDQRVTNATGQHNHQNVKKPRLEVSHHKNVKKPAQVLHIKNATSPKTPALIAKSAKTSNACSPKLTAKPHKNPEDARCHNLMDSIEK